MTQLSKGWQYAHDVISGKQVASQWVLKACQRALKDLETSETSEDYDWVFSQKAADHVVQFCSFIKHVKGATAGEAFEPEGWQCFMLEQVFGWRRKDNLQERRFREAIVEVARKQGKSYIASVLTLYELLFTEDSPEIYSVATKRDQAKLVWQSAVEISSKMDKRMSGRLKKTISALTNTETFGSYKFVGRDSDTLDGLNPSLVVVDEAAAITDRNLVEVFESATGARLNPLIVYITTAQFTRTTAYYDKRQYLKTILDGIAEDDRVFGVLYCLEEDEDWTNPDNWIKANPNLNVSIYPDYLETQVTQALAMPSKKNGVLVKHFNIFTTGSGGWLDVSHWDKCAGEVEREGKCFLGVDLSDKNDLSAVCRLWANGEHYSVDFQCWVSEAAFKNAPVHIRPIYNLAKETGILQVSPGELVDHRDIQNYIEKSYQQYDVLGVGYDPYHSSIMVNNLEDLGIPMLEVRQSISHMSPSVYECEKIITEHKIRHENNKLLEWCLGNVEVYIDLNDNKKLRKGEDPTLKIDPIIALVMSMALAAGQLDEPSEFNFSFVEI